MSVEKRFSDREVAALQTAIAWLRNELIWISAPNAEIDMERIARLIDSTSIEKLEEALSLPKGSLAIDRKKLITAGEERCIAANDTARPESRQNKNA